jgi:beta-phosphoglucomutase
MNTIKGCIFDLDGVIVDTAKYHYLAWKKLAQELEINFSIADNERLKGISRIESLEILLSHGNISFDHNTKLKLAEKKNTLYVDYISKINKSEVLPGIETFIKSLKEQNLKIALGSSSKNANLILKKIDMLEFFDSVIDGNKISKTKPNPEIFLLCAKEIGLRPENCMVFEDSEAGLIAAKRAGMYAVGIGRPDILKSAHIVINGFHSTSLSKLLQHEN